MNIDFSNINSIILIILALGAGFLSALWLALIFWTWRDISSRTRSVFTQVLAVLVVTVLYVPGILVYMILRPAHTIEEDYQMSLEEEALMVSIENQAVCPGCERHVREDWQICPVCHTKLKKSCQNCLKLLELTWEVCPFCAAPSPVLDITKNNENLAVTQELTPDAEKEILETLELKDEKAEEEPIIYFENIDDLDELSGYQKFKVIEKIEKEQDSEEEPK